MVRLQKCYKAKMPQTLRCKVKKCSSPVCNMRDPNVLLRSAVWKQREVDLIISYYIRNDPLANFFSKLQFTLLKTAQNCSALCWLFLFLTCDTDWCVWGLLLSPPLSHPTLKRDTGILLCEEKKKKEEIELE